MFSGLSQFEMEEFYAREAGIAQQESQGIQVPPVEARQTPNLLTPALLVGAAVLLLIWGRPYMTRK